MTHTLELIDKPNTAVQAQPAGAVTLSQEAELSGLVRQALQMNAGLETINALIAIRNDEIKRQAKLAFQRDFAAFRGENVIIPKSKYVDRGKAGSFNQAEYEAVGRMLSPALSKHGFSFRHDQRFGSRKWTTDGTESDIPWVHVTCYLDHKDGHGEVLELEGPSGDMSANTPVQNMQVTASYLKRQSLLAITGTATGGEDDEAKMKQAGGAERNPAKAGEIEALVDAGREEALKGMPALTAWWSKLDARQQKELGPDFGAMRKTARGVTEGAK